MDRWTGRVALVTGANVGIGAAITRALLKSGLVVVTCDKDVDQLNELAKTTPAGKLHVRKCDLVNETETEALFKWIKDNVGGVDICINNAGIGDYGSLLGPEATVAKWRHMLNVNVVALCHCTQLAINSMRERNVDDGQIIHISSLLGHHQPVITSNHFYSATKFAVNALTEGHRQELRAIKSNIRVAAISPGFVESEFVYNATGGDRDMVKKVYSVLKEFLQPEDIANAVVYILSAPSHVQVHDVLMRSIYQDQ